MNAAKCTVARRTHRTQLQFTPEQRDTIIGILSHGDASPGTRAGRLLRQYPALLNHHRTKNPGGFSLVARLLYLHLAQFVGADPKLPRDQVRVSRKLLATWLGCKERHTSAAIGELTKHGPLPLLLQVIGKPGRASVYTFVRNPFAVAEQQEAAAVKTRRTRQPRVIAAQAAVFAAQSAGVIDATEATRRGLESRKRRDWALPTRQRPVIVVNNDVPIIDDRPVYDFDDV